MMHMAGFKQAVKKLAEKDYHGVEHRITEYHTGEVSSLWRAYLNVNDIGFTAYHTTPEAALSELKKLCSASK